MRWAVILAGGSGTRFWPLSTPENPKQLLPLAGSTSTAEESIERLAGLIPRERILVVTGAGAGSPAAATAQAFRRQHPGRAPRRLHRSGAHLGHHGSSAARSRGRGALAARRLGRGRRGGISPNRRCGTHHRSPARASGHGRRGPSRPETGYGYIVPGPPLGDGARMVARFSEKPDAATALDLMAAGALWNSGLFAWTAERLLAEVEAHTPEVAPHLPAAPCGRRRGLLPEGHPDLDRCGAAGAQRLGGGGERRRLPGTTSAPGRR